MTKGRFLKASITGTILIPILENIPSNTKIKGCS